MMGMDKEESEVEGSRSSATQINCVTYEDILNLVEDIKTMLKENAIKSYYYSTSPRFKSTKVIGAILNRILRSLGVRLQRTSAGLYHISDVERSWAIDFLLYVIREEPRLDLRLFDECDRKEVMKFIRNEIRSALLPALDKSALFNKEDMMYCEGYRVFRKHIKKSKDHYVLRWRGREYRLPVNHFEAPVFFHKHGIDKLPPVIITRVEGMDFIDGGAFIGDSALVLSELKPRRIYAFEPDYKNFLLLKKTLSLNNLTQVIPIRMVLGARRGKTRLFSFGSGSFVSNIYREHGGEEVEVISIDEFVKENGLEVGLIKLDVEGSELDVIVGAKETIRAYKPVLIVSLYHRGQDFFEIPRIIKELVPEYKLRFLNLDRESPTADRILLSYVERVEVTSH